MARAAERHVAMRLWSIRLRTIVASGAIAAGLGIVVFVVSYGVGFSNGRSAGLIAGKTIAAAMADGSAAAQAWSRLMAANDPVAALKNCKTERDARGRRYCRMPVWLDPPVMRLDR